MVSPRSTRLKNGLAGSRVREAIARESSRAIPASERRRDTPSSSSFDSVVETMVPRSARPIGVAFWLR